MADSEVLVAPSLRSVAARAGVSLGTIHYYFRSKEELLEACLDGYYDRLGELASRLLRLSGEAEEGRDFVEQAAAELYDFGYRQRAMLALRMMTNAQRGQLHPRRQEEFMGQLSLHAARGLQAHVEVDELDARFAVQAAASMVVRFALLSDSELSCLTDLKGEEARVAARDYVIRAIRRLVRPGDG